LLHISVRDQTSTIATAVLHFAMTFHGLLLLFAVGVNQDLLADALPNTGDDQALLLQARMRADAPQRRRSLVDCDKT